MAEGSYAGEKGRFSVTFWGFFPEFQLGTWYHVIKDPVRSPINLRRDKDTSRSLISAEQEKNFFLTEVLFVKKIYNFQETLTCNENFLDIIFFELHRALRQWSEKLQEQITELVTKNLKFPTCFSTKMYWDKKLQNSWKEISPKISRVDQSGNIITQGRSNSGVSEAFFVVVAKSAKKEIMRKMFCDRSVKNKKRQKWTLYMLGPFFQNWVGGC